MGKGLVVRLCPACGPLQIVAPVRLALLLPLSGPGCYGGAPYAIRPYAIKPYAIKPYAIRESRLPRWSP